MGIGSSTEGIFRIIQSIRSPKAEPFKLKLAELAAARVSQRFNSELSLQQMIDDYRRLGYSDEWINQLLSRINLRNDQTDDSDPSGKHQVQEGRELAGKADVITKQWSGKTTQEYKNLKGLKNEDLKVNMTNIEMALNNLAEAAATEISKVRNPKDFAETIQVAKEGGEVAKNARLELESKLKKSVVSSEKASDHPSLPINLAEVKASEEAGFDDMF